MEHTNTNATANSSPMRGFKAAKCFEGAGAFVVWHVTARTGGGDWEKFYLVADARQRSFGVHVERQRTDDLQANGSVVGMLRKHARTCGIGRIWRHLASGNIWLPLFTSGGAAGESPDFWLELANSSPPELRFVDKDGVALIRKSSQGTYTKRRELRAFGETLPNYAGLGAGEHQGFEDLSHDLFAKAALLSPKHADANAAAEPHDASRGDTPELATAAPPTDDASALPTGDARALPTGDAMALPTGDAMALSTADAKTLPDYQRTARDRLVRRLKTVRKALLKQQQSSSAATLGLSIKAQADLLTAHLHEIRPGALALVVTTIDDQGNSLAQTIELDPKLSAGQNLEDFYARAKKAGRAQTALKEHLATALAAVASLAADVEHLRAAPLPLREVEVVLARHQLMGPGQVQSDAVQGGGRKSHGAAAAPLPYRVFTYATPAAAPVVRILVGKSAADSDTLCRQAKGNDIWLHAVATTGSHVIIPAQELRPLLATLGSGGSVVGTAGAAGAGGNSLAGIPPALLRAAAILALHFSKKRDDQQGEVYVSRRQYIKKRKGMAPGLWQIDKAETMLVRYDHEELSQVLSVAQ